MIRVIKKETGNNISRTLAISNIFLTLTDSVPSSILSSFVGKKFKSEKGVPISKEINDLLREYI